FGHNPDPPPTNLSAQSRQEAQPPSERPSRRARLWRPAFSPGPAATLGLGTDGTGRPSSSCLGPPGRYDAGSIAFAMAMFSPIFPLPTSHAWRLSGALTASNKVRREPILQMLSISSYDIRVEPQARSLGTRTSGPNRARSLR